MSIYIFSGIFLYLIIGLGLFVIQRRLIFNKSDKPKKPVEYGLSEIKEVFIDTLDNLTLLAWFQKPKNNNPILIYFLPLLQLNQLIISLLFHLRI